MLELIVIAIFIIGLISCISMSLSVIYALLFGVILFSSYAKIKGFSAKEILAMLIAGMKKVKNILLVFVCIGCLTAIWRICGTIPYIVYYSADFIIPDIFVFCSFALCCILSYLTGSSFATAGTVGTICMMLGNASGIPQIPLGGAIMSGCYFGDRCSPMSSSALLVAEVTRTNIYDNIKAMFKTATIPFIISCSLYLLLSYDFHGILQNQSLAIFQESFRMHWICLIPALLTIVLCACKVEVKKTMIVSVVVGILICLGIQKVSLSYIIKTMLFGFHPIGNEELSILLEGGGISSMVNVACIVCLSSCFSGIFDKTGLLNPIEGKLKKLSYWITKEGTFLLTAILTCMLSCNQSLAAILTNELSQSYEPDEKKRASWLEDTVIVIAPLIPWSVASAVPLAILGVPVASLLYAWYLYLLPISLLFSRVISVLAKGNTKNVSRN